MVGRVESGQLCKVVPIADYATLRAGDIVLCRVHGAEYLHLVKAIDSGGKRFQIGSNKGRINGWVSPTNIYGICVEVSP